MAFALAAVLFILTVALYHIHRRRIKRKTAPEVAGAWPLLGHLPQLAGPESPHKTLGAMADKLGAVFTIRLGVHKAVVVSRSDVAKELFTVNDRAVSSRPKLFTIQHLCYNYAMFVFAPYGPFWREMRKIVTLELLSNRQLEISKRVRGSEVEAWLKEIYKLSQKKEVSLDMKELFGDLTMSIILRMVAGKKLYCAATEEVEEARRFKEAIRVSFDLMGAFVLRDAVPFLGWMDRGHEKAVKRVAKEMDEIISSWMEEHKRKRASNDKDKDFMDIMLSVLQDSGILGGGSDAYADTVNKATALSLIAGGIDTSQVTLTWALSLLLNNREKLEKAHEELDMHVGKKRLVQESDIPNLTYLRAIIKETLRLFPPGPLSAPRELVEDSSIGGYSFAKGTRLIVNLWKIQTDPRVWEDPMEFRPERFLTTHKDVDVMGKHFELLPFGAGRRGCPGTSMGLRVVHLALASFLHAFQLSTESGELVDMSERTGLTNIKATPLEVLVSPRLRPGLFGL